MRSTSLIRFDQLKSAAKLYGWQQGHETLPLRAKDLPAWFRAKTEFFDCVLSILEGVAKAVNENGEDAGQHLITFGDLERLACARRARGFIPTSTPSAAKKCGYAERRMSSWQLDAFAG